MALGGVAGWNESEHHWRSDGAQGKSHWFSDALIGNIGCVETFTF